MRSSTSSTVSMRRSRLPSVPVVLAAACLLGVTADAACGLETGGTVADGGSGDGPSLDGHTSGGDDGGGGDDGSAEAGDDGGGDGACARTCGGVAGNEVVDCHGALIETCEASTCSAGACVAWSPAALPGLVLWLRADSVADAGASVATWPDKSGMGHDATQAVAASQPTYAANWKNGQPALAFSGAQFFSNTATSLVPGNSAYSVLTVAQSTGAPSAALLSLRITTPFAASILYEGTGFTYIWNGSGSGVAVDDVSAAVQNPFHSIHRYVGGAVAPKFFLNGTEHAVTGGNPMDESAGTQGFEIGSNPSAQMWKGKIAEIVVVSNAISDSDRASWDAYAKARYGL